MRESNIGSELKEMAQEVMRFGERCVEAGREWLNERRDDVNNRYSEGRHDSRSGHDYEREPGQQELSRNNREQGERGEYGRRLHGQESMSGRSRSEPYGSRPFDDRLQGNSGWEGGRSGRDYAEGSQRPGAGYEPDDHRQGHSAGRYGQPAGQQEYGGHNPGTADYYRGRQGFSAQESFGGEYGSYGRNQGFGEGSGYTRSSQTHAGGQRSGSSHAYGSQSGRGGRGALGTRDYPEERGLTGYGGRELSTQQQGSRSSGRYGTEPGQYGYGGYGMHGFRGVGPKNYTRSDERIAEEINERLTDDDELDASEIMVRAVNGKVTLEGSVDQRWMKHRAEDIADSCLGVKEVDNRIQVLGAGRTMDPSTSEKGSTRSPTTGATGSTTTTGGTSGSSASGTTPH